ncbi:hypothetical protein [Aquimarina sp. RZ0]|uniref:hypothetical protein n=1 Tax=Aquimarina sp. RZ0 TaxID=2607730 RepID=UPI0011F181ED|nr:hypothetical protein [Aquimarina sp. RZ0]KAA1242920.1 hypothetical protein F0000_23380 [Aquimarina sp. RZ0]
MENNSKKLNITNTRNWYTWCSSYINPIVLRGELELMIDKIDTDIIEFPLFTKQFCDEIIQLAEQNTWLTDRHGSYPTTDQELSTLKMNSIYQKVLEEFVYPIWKKFWDLNDQYLYLDSENFIVKYDIHNQGSLNLHHDGSLITMNLRLNDDFEGGGTFIPKFNKVINPSEIGSIIAHPGRITHKHGGRPVKSGTRYILITFTKNRRLQYDLNRFV